MTGCESVETTIRRRRLLFAGFLLRQQLDRLPRALLQGGLVNGSNRHRRGRPEKSWWSYLTDDLKAFEITEGECKTLAKDRSRWCERVSQGAEVFMSAWRDNERDVALTRHARQAETRTSTLDPPSLRLSLSVFPSDPNWVSPPSPFALSIEFASRVFFLAIYLWGSLCTTPLPCRKFLLYGEGRLPGTGYRFLTWPRAVSCATSPIAL